MILMCRLRLHKTEDGQSMSVLSAGFLFCYPNIGCNQDDNEESINDGGDM